MTDEELQAIKARCEAATPGAWKPGGPPTGLRQVKVYAVSEGMPFGDWIASARLPRQGAKEHRQALANAAFIAHARQDVPALVAEVERLQDEVQREKNRAEFILSENEGLRRGFDPRVTLLEVRLSMLRRGD